MVLSDTIQHKADSKVLNGASLSGTSTVDTVKELAELLPQIIYEMDLSGKLTFVNKQALELFRYSQKDFETGFSAFDMLASQEVQRAKENIARVMKGERLGGTEYIFKRNDGTTFPGLLYSTPIIQDSRPVGFRGVIVDISEQKKAEDQLKQILDATTDGIWTWNFKTNILFFSPKYYTMLRYDPNEFSATFENWRDLIHPDDRAKALATTEEYLKTKPDVYENEFRLRTKSGAYRWIHAKAKVVQRDEHGDAVFMIGNHEDITERRQVGENLRQSEEKFRLLFNGALAGIALVDKNGVIQMANDCLLHLLSIRKEDFIGRNFVELIRVFGLDVPENVADFNRRLREMPSKREITFLNKNNSKTTISVQSSVIKSGDELLGVLYIVTDITEGKQAEEEIKSLARFPSEDPSPVLRVTKDGTVVYCNTAGVLILDFWKTSVGGAVPERWCNIIGKKFASKNLKAEEEEEEEEVNDKIFSFVVAPVADEGYVNLYGRDITDRKKMEEVLRKEKEFTGNIIRTAQAIILVLDSKGCIISINPFMEKISGYNLEEVQGKDWFETFLPKEDKIRIREIFQRSIGDIQTQGNINPIVAKDGHIVEVEWYDKTLKTVDGSLIGLLAIGQDITERKRAEDRLKESEEKLRSIVENSSDQIFMLDKDYKFLSVNKTAADISRKSPQEMVGLSIFEIFPEDLAVQFSKNVKQVFDTGKSFFIEEKMVVQGHELYNSASLNPVTGGSGRVIAVSGIVRDISERKTMEEALRKSEEKYHTIADFTFDWETWLGVDGKYLYVSPACKRISGYSPEDFIANPQLLEEIAHPDDRQKIHNHICTHIKENNWESDHIDFRIITKNGQERWISHYCQPVYSKDGVFLGKRASNRDITERKSAERQISDALSFNQSILSTSPTGIFVYSTSGQCILANEAAAKVAGATVDKLLAQNFYHLESWKKSGLLQAAEKAIANNALEQIETKVITTFGKDTWLSLQFFPFMFKGERHLLVLSDEITERKRTEKELQETNEKLRFLTTGLEQKVNERTLEIEQLLKQKDEFIQMLGHDLKNPLTPLVTLLPIIQKKEQDVKQKELLQVVQRNVHIIKELVEKTVKLAILSEPTVHFETQPIPLGSEVEKSINILEAMFTDHHIITENLISDTVVVDVEPMRLREILDNLFTNSVKFSPAGGKITVDAQPDNDMVVISVKDTGIGITLEQMPHIFEEFYKADFSRHDLDSSGLGLPICKRIVEKHGGKIWAESHGTDKGSTIFFTLRSVKKPK